MSDTPEEPRGSNDRPAEVDALRAQANPAAFYPVLAAENARLRAEVDALEEAAKVLPFGKPGPSAETIAKSIQDTVTMLDTSFKSFFELWLKHELELAKLKVEAVKALAGSDGANVKVSIDL